MSKRTLGVEQVDWRLFPVLEEDIPEHVQAYFQVIEQRMLHSEEFMNFWDNMQVPESYGDAIKNFEVEFTQYFGKKDSSILLGWR